MNLIDNVVKIIDSDTSIPNSEMGKEIILNCISGFDDSQMELLEHMLSNFKDISRGDLASGVSVIYMNYKKHGITKYKDILNKHSELFDASYTSTAVERWVALYISTSKPLSMC